MGCGGMGSTHYKALRVLQNNTDVEVVALADSREEFLDKAAAYFPEAKKYDNGMDLIEKEDLDVVHICLPSYLHVSHAVAAMEKGCDVFVEKPVCLTTQEANEIQEVQKRTGRKIMVGHVVRFLSEYQYLKNVYDSKELGNLRCIMMQRVSGDVTWGYKDWFHDEELSGSVVLDLHVHDVDFLRYMLGEPDEFAVRATSFETGMINQIITDYRFGNVFVTAEGVWDVSSALKFEASYRAHFEKGTIVFNGGRNPKLIVYKADGTSEIPELDNDGDGVIPQNAGDEAAGVEEIRLSDLGAYYTEDEYFYDCVRNNKEIEVAPLSEGVKSVELALKEWEAAKAYIAKYQ